MDKGYKTIELPATVPGVGYSLKHRLAVQELINYYCSKAVGKKDGNGEVFTKEDLEVMKNRGICHDMDKILMMLNYPQLTADYYHRMYNSHHPEGYLQPVCKYDWIEMIFDWESARYTKPDKGKCAYEVATTFNSHLFEYVKPYLLLFDFTNINNKCIESIKKSVNRKVTEQDLVDAFLNYIHCTNLHRLEGLSRLDQRGYQEINGGLAPFRHPSTSVLYRQRPTNYTKQSHSLTARELIDGVVEVSAFDFDSICRLKVSSLDYINKSCIDICNKLTSLNKQR